jgi:hypothetical protein
MLKLDFYFDKHGEPPKTREILEHDWYDLTHGVPVYLSDLEEYTKEDEEEETPDFKKLLKLADKLKAQKPEFKNKHVLVWLHPAIMKYLKEQNYTGILTHSVTKDAHNKTFHLIKGAALIEMQ